MAATQTVYAYTKTDDTLHTGITYVENIEYMR